MTLVKPGPPFEGIEDGVAFELYWAEFNPMTLLDAQLEQKQVDNN